MKITQADDVTFHRLVSFNFVVYILLDGDEVVYVGKTADLKHRLGAHRNAVVYDVVRYMVVDDARQAAGLEAGLIAKYQPKYNTEGTGKPRNFNGNASKFGVVDLHGVTLLQRETLVAIDDFIKANGFSPSVRELGKTLCVGSPNGMASKLQSLVKKGLITRQATTAQSILITDKGKSYLASVQTSIAG